MFPTKNVPSKECSLKIMNLADRSILTRRARNSPTFTSFRIYLLSIGEACDERQAGREQHCRHSHVLNCLYLRVHVPAWAQLAGFYVNQAAVASSGHYFGDQHVPIRPPAFSKGRRGALDGAGAGLDNFLFVDPEATER